MADVVQKELASLSRFNPGSSIAKKEKRRLKRKLKRKLKVSAHILTRVKQGPTTAPAVVKGSTKAITLARGGPGFAGGNVVNHASDPRAIAMSIACPAANFTPRVSTSLTASRTAVGNPWLRKNIGTNGTANNYFTQGASTLFAAAFRDPCRAMIYSDLNIGTSSAVYVAYGSDTTNIHSQSAPATTWVVKDTEQQQFFPIGVNYWKTQSGPQPHGPILCCGTPDGTADIDDRYTWCDNLTAVSANITTSGSTVSGFEAEVWVWAPEGPRLLTSQTCNQGTGVSLVLKDVTNPAGYYAWRIGYNLVGNASVGDITINSITYTTPNTQQVMCHRPLPNFENFFASAKAVRINAASITLTNNTSVLNRGASSAAYQAPAGQHWFNLAVDNQQIPSAQNSAEIDAKNGMYTWLKPTDETDLKMLERHESNGGVLYDTHFALDAQSQFIAMQLVDTSGSLSFTGFWTFNFGIEFQSEDVSREVREPDTRKEVYDEALQLLHKMPQFAENPTHWADLMRSISKGATTALNWGMKNAPTLLKGAQLIGEIASML